MLIGFKITQLNGDFDGAVEFIKKYCFLPSDKTAENLVFGFERYNIFSDNLTTDLLDEQIFDYEPIFFAGEYMYISIVDFLVSIVYEQNQGLVYVDLEPTGYRQAVREIVEQLKSYEKQGYIRIIPLLNSQVNADFTKEDFTYTDFNTD